MLSKLSEIFCGITIGVSVKIGRRLIIEHSGGIFIHSNVVMGDDCIISQGVTLGNKVIFQPLDAPSLGYRLNIGAGAKILDKVFVGDYVDIGAKAAVIKDIPSNSLAVCVPAKISLKKSVTPVIYLIRNLPSASSNNLNFY